MGVQVLPALHIDEFSQSAFAPIYLPYKQGIAPGESVTVGIIDNPVASGVLTTKNFWKHFGFDF
jgi:hypothetical protein